MTDSYKIAWWSIIFLIGMTLHTTAHAADMNTIYHFGGSAVISGGIVVAGGTKTQAIVLTSGIGLMKELGDSKVSGEDIAADIGGAVFGAFAAEYLTWRW